MPQRIQNSVTGGWPTSAACELPAGGSERHAARGWSYLQIHPFADQHELLAGISVRPEDCWGVDAYWRTEDDVHLLQVRSSRIDSTRSAGLYARVAENDVYFLNLVGVVQQPAITRDLFEEVMAKFTDSGILVDSGALGESLTLVASL